MKRFLERWPILYSVAMRTYTSVASGFARLNLSLFGTGLREREWRKRHLKKGNDWGNTTHIGEEDEWVMGYWDSREHSHRSFLVERISRHAPLESVLEVGCNCGPNLYLLAKRFPKADIVGIDINPMAIKRGNELLSQEGITNVTLLEARADQLQQFPDKSFDIVFTDAVLIYIGPDKIGAVVGQMTRITRKALVLVEWHSFKSNGSDCGGLGTYHEGKWKRNYVALLRQFVGEEQIHVTRLTDKIWPDKNWQRIGACVEVVM